jgi:shikimate kinase
LVAEVTGHPFRDTDADVEAVAGMTVSDIFVQCGEEQFRRLEREAVTRALAQHPGVLALGGGAVLAPTTREALAGQRVVFLDVGLAEASQRVGLNRSRPLLVVNPRAELSRMLVERRPLYEAVATMVIGTDGRTAQDVAAEVVRLLVGE